VNYTRWHQTAARTSQTRIMLQPTSNSHASLWSIPKQEMADCHVTPWVWAEHTRTATT